MSPTVEIAMGVETPTAKTAAATMLVEHQLPAENTKEHICGKFATTTNAMQMVKITKQVAQIKTPTPLPALKVPVQERVLKVKSRVQKIREPLTGHQ